MGVPASLSASMLPTYWAWAKPCPLHANEYRTPGAASPATGSQVELMPIQPPQACWGATSLRLGNRSRKPRTKS